MAIQYKGETLTAHKQKELVKKWAGFDDRTYKKEYDKFKNRVYNYERAMRLPRGTISPVDEFARLAKGRYFGKGDYRPSALIEGILRTSSGSPSKQLGAKAQYTANTIAVQSALRSFWGVYSTQSVFEATRNTGANVLTRLYAQEGFKNIAVETDGKGNVKIIDADTGEDITGRVDASKVYQRLKLTARTIDFQRAQAVTKSKEYKADKYSNRPVSSN